MIIECPNCSKKFILDDSLLPKKGRLLKCGLCKKTWFYKLDSADNENTHSQTFEQQKSIIENKSTNESKKKEISTSLNDEKLNYSKRKKTKNLITKFLSFFVVIIISFIGVIIILDTFKSPLIQIYPKLELILYNLFETIKDIFLFLKNLLN